MPTTAPPGRTTDPLVGTIEVVRRGRRPDRSNDPWSVLGLERGATSSEIATARKALARAAHPDTGGSVEAMQLVNAAADAALAEIDAADRIPDGKIRRDPPPAPRGGVRHDHPSFTVEVLPAEAFEGLLVVASVLGDVIDDDPPYLLEVTMLDPVAAWCRLELVPDAGATTVSITTARLPGQPTPEVIAVRDAWIEALNRLDWSDPDQPPRPS